MLNATQKLVIASGILLVSYSIFAQPQPDSTLSVYSVNIPSPAFSPVYFDQGLLYITRATTLDPKDKNYFDIAYSAVKDSCSFYSPVFLQTFNTLYHEGPLAIDSLHNQYFITRSQTKKNKPLLDEKGLNQLGIFITTYAGKSSLLDFNSPNFSSAHPTLSADGLTMYFSSNRPGGFGGMDIWKTNKTGKNWGTPIHLDESINSTANEVFPYLYQDSVLYFSSDRDTSGLDIYVAEKNKLAEKLPPPINSSKDDFGIIINSTRNKGYFSSNRQGNDRIFAFRKKPLTFSIKEKIIHLTILDAHTKLPLQGIHAAIFGQDTTHYTSDSFGKIIFNINTSNPYEVQFFRTDYIPKSVFFTDTLDFTQAIIITISPKEKEPTKIENKPKTKGTPFKQKIILENIYYDYNDSKINPNATGELNRLAKILANHKGIRIRLIAYTDSRGTAKYNERLSRHRARTAKAYLILKGIEQNRIEIKGRGERNIRNQCKDNVACTEEEHRLNRRTEVIFLNPVDELLLIKNDLTTE